MVFLDRFQLLRLQQTLPHQYAKSEAAGTTQQGRNCNIRVIFDGKECVSSKDTQSICDDGSKEYIEDVSPIILFLKKMNEISLFNYLYLGDYMYFVCIGCYCNEYIGLVRRMPKGENAA